MGTHRCSQRKRTIYESCSNQLEVTSIEWKDASMSEEEEELIFRMHKLVGDRWSLIAGRIPGRTPEMIERFWLIKHGFFLAN